MEEVASAGRRDQFTLRGSLLAVGVLSAYLGLAIDTHQRFTRFQILLMSAYNYTDAQIEAATAEVPWVFIEMAALAGATIGLCFWAVRKVLGKPRPFQGTAPTSPPQVE